MNLYYSVALLIISFLVVFFNLIVFFKNNSSKVNQNFALFGLSIFVWLIFYAFAYQVEDLDLKFQLFHKGYVGIIFIPVFFYSFIFYFLQNKKKNFLIYINFCIAILFLIGHFTYFPLILGLNKYSWGYYPNGRFIQSYAFFTFFISLFFISNTSLAVNCFFRSNKYSSIQLNRIRYAFFGSIVGSFGALDFLGNYGVSFVPIGVFFVFLYPLIFSYAILKYRFLDVSLVVTRTTIFICLYTLILGIPFILAFFFESIFVHFFDEKWWIVPLVASTTLASVGPYLFSFIQKKAEATLLQEQRQYQNTLRKASLGMGRVKNLKRLLALIVHIVIRAVKLNYCAIYLLHQDSSQFILKASKLNSNKEGHKNLIPPIPLDSPLVKHLLKTKEPILSEEIKQMALDYKSYDYEALYTIMKEMNVELVVPSFIESNLIAIIVLGKKMTGKLYSHDDLAVFSILANQAALAIENAQFYENMKKTQEQLFKAEKMATIGTMADGLSHQINNRLHAMGFVASDALDTIKMVQGNDLDEEKKKEMLADLEYSIGRIQENVKRGGEVVEGLLKYTRKGNQGMEEFHIEEILKAAFEMAQFKIKINRLEVRKSLDENLPKIYGNFTQLQEVLFNIIDNGYDAMMQRADELKEDGYQPTLSISAEVTEKMFQITIVDNGIGVKREDQTKLFTPFFTTKATSKKGTGLGLYVIRQIIEDNHHGRIKFFSNYKKGSEFHIHIPRKSIAQKIEEENANI